MALKNERLDRASRARHKSTHRVHAKRSSVRLNRRAWSLAVSTADADDLGAPAVPFRGWVS